MKTCRDCGDAITTSIHACSPEVKETIDMWHIYKRSDGTHYAAWGEGRRYETIVDVENGRVYTERKHETTDTAVPLAVILRLAELDGQS